MHIYSLGSFPCHALRNHSGGFQFPKSADSSTSWIQLPPGYASQSEDLESGRLPQVGLLYRSEVMAILLSPANNR